MKALKRTTGDLFLVVLLYFKIMNCVCFFQSHVNGDSVEARYTVLLHLRDTNLNLTLHVLIST